MTQDDRIAKRSPGEGLVLVEQQKPEASNQTRFNVRYKYMCGLNDMWTKGFSVWLTMSHCSFYNEIFLSFLLSFPLNFVLFDLGGGYKGRGHM